MIGRTALKQKDFNMKNIKYTQIITALALIVFPMVAHCADGLGTGSRHIGAVQDWWLHCNGYYPNSTCLSDTELSKFKTICSNKIYKGDCKMIVDYVVAKTRSAEGKFFLTKGFVSQILNFSANKKYLNDLKKIWDQEEVNAFSFAMGVLPSCSLAGKKKLVFSKNLRPDLKELQKEFLKIYETLSSIPCPDVKNGFILVAIGKVHDSNDEFEVFTIDENKNFKIIRTALELGPFLGAAR